MEAGELSQRLVGANWGRCVVLKGNFDPTSGKAKQARVAFIKAYAHALKLQAETKTIIVYFDETYLNTGHVSKMSWHLNGHRGLSTQAKGRRLIVLHALTKDGWVRGKRADAQMWARCDSSGCNKWRLLCPLTGRQANGSMSPCTCTWKDSLFWIHFILV